VDAKARHPLIDALAAIQERDGLTSADIARRLQVNPSTITRLMSGDMQPSLRTVQMINRTFAELRSQCAALLLIGNDDVADQECPAEAVAS
jgi:predicted transcriptional regulator